MVKRTSPINPTESPSANAEFLPKEDGDPMENPARKLEKKKRILLLGAVIVVFLIVMVPLMALLSATTYGPTEELWTYVAEEDYAEDGNFTVFAPDVPNDKGIVLYPGAFVDPLSYAFLGHRLAEEGYLVCVLSVPFKLSIFASMKAEEFIAIHPEVTSWVVGGHSMGGVSASMFAAKRPDLVDGLILLASYPASSTDLSGSDLPVLSIYAELDGLTTLTDIEESKDLLPDSAVFVEIPGGNHAGFGMYGDQKNDNPALITNLAQQELLVQHILDFLD